MNAYIIMNGLRSEEACIIHAHNDSEFALWFNQYAYAETCHRSRMFRFVDELNIPTSPTTGTADSIYRWQIALDIAAFMMVRSYNDLELEALGFAYEVYTQGR